MEHEADRIQAPPSGVRAPRPRSCGFRPRRAPGGPRTRLSVPSSAVSIRATERRRSGRRSIGIGTGQHLPAERQQRRVAGTLLPQKRIAVFRFFSFADFSRPASLPPFRRIYHRSYRRATIGRPRVSRASPCARSRSPLPPRPLPSTQ